MLKKRLLIVACLLHISNGFATDQSLKPNLETDYFLKSAYQNHKNHLEALHQLQLPTKLIPLQESIAYEYFSDENWVLIDSKKGCVYQNLDNDSLAGIEAVIDDPFLVIRTKISPTASLQDSWQHFASFEAVEPITYPEVSIEQTQESTDRETKVETLPSLPCDLAISNKETYFNSLPIFTLNNQENKKTEKINWQISSFANFDFVLPSLEGIQEASHCVQINGLTDTFLNSQVQYYFRVRTMHEGLWSDWSTPFAFISLKPLPPENIEFKEDHDEFIIEWKSEPSCNFHVFASNSLDFIPEIYSNEHLLAVTEDGLQITEKNQNLIKITNKNSIKINGEFAFYRIITERDGYYSVPSPLIYVYDSSFQHSRNVLQKVGNEIKRVELPKRYSYLNHPIFEKEFEEEMRTYAKSPHVSDEVWNSISRYLLPENHPIKRKLDRLFSKKRVTANGKTIREAGFLNAKPGPFSKCIITKHKKMQGYFFKFFADDQKDIVDWKQLRTRVKAARSVQKNIDRHKWNHLFKAPKKWLYPLPPTPAPAPIIGSRKNFILIAEDMHILEKKQNYLYWKTHVTPAILDGLYVILQEEGLVDSAVAFNLPFGKDGRIAFVDTEHFQKWPIPFYKLARYLSPQMQDYWQKVVHAGEKK